VLVEYAKPTVQASVEETIVWTALWLRVPWTCECGVSHFRTIARYGLRSRFL
jgi:hypothetical protein